MFSTAFKDALSPAAVGIPGRMRDVMKDKHRLTGKFAFMASVLDPELADEDLERFNNLKKVREAFFHTLASSLADLKDLLPRQRRFLPTIADRGRHRNLGGNLLRSAASG